jgi:hypothetical protein
MDGAANQCGVPCSCADTALAESLSLTGLGFKIDGRLWRHALDLPAE